MDSSMNPRYREALDAVLNELKELPWVSGVLFFGSVQRGEAGPGSDLDVYVVTAGDQYWRATRYYRGVETELFFNPEPKMRERIESRRDVAAIHGFATGDVLMDRTGIMAELTARAREIWEAGPPAPTDDDILTWRYRLTSLRHDLEDVSADPVALRYMAGVLAQSSCQAFCAIRRIWGAKPKNMTAFVGEQDPQIGRLVSELLLEPDPAVARLLVDHVLDPVGGRLGAFEGPRHRHTRG